MPTLAQRRDRALTETRLPTVVGAHRARRGFLCGAGAKLTLVGSDELWVFGSGHLAVDLGGLHQLANGCGSLHARASALGIAKGDAYDLDLLQAARHSKGSDFRVDTNLSFVSCRAVAPHVTVH